MKVPAVTEFKTSCDFVRGLIEVNGETKGFSHRFLAKKLKFPAAYLSDVVNGRRKLTLSRAVQMAQALAMDGVDTEYLVTLVLRDSSKGAARIFFENQTRRRYRKSDQMTTNDPEGRYSRIETLAIKALAPGLTSGTAVENLKKMLVTFPDYSRDDVEWTLARLVRDGVLEIDAHGTYQSKKTIFIQSDNVSPRNDPVHRQYAENFIRYYDLRMGPATMNSAFIRVPHESFEKIRERVLIFRDWLLELDQPYDPKDNRLHMVFQFDLNMFPIHHK